MKYNNVSKSEWLGWLDSELSPPITATGSMLDLLMAFKSLLTDQIEKELIEKVLGQSLCWTENKASKMLKPDWIKLTKVEIYVYKGYIEAYNHLFKKESSHD